MKSTKTSRRQFLKHSASAAAGLVLTSPFLPATAKSYRRILGANDRLQVGAIGCGGMGNAHLDALMGMKNSDLVDLVSVCDIYQKRLDEAAAKTGGKAIQEYRKLLENQELDYVMIASPEHWHHRMIMDSLDAGKHVYVEKPMTHEIQEAQEVVAKVKSSGLKLQVGVQGMSDDSYITAQQYIQEGILGKVTMAQIDYCRNGNLWMASMDEGIKPGVNLDWEAWQGPAPKVAWDPQRYFRWRRYWDYSGGVATDLFIHRLTRVLKALDLKMPEYVTASGGHYFFTGEEKAQVPDTFNMMLDYPGGPNVLLVSTQKNNTPIRHLIKGDQATLEFTRTGFTITPQQSTTKALIPGTGEALPLDKDGVFQHKKSGAEDITLHHRNLQAAIRDGAKLNCDAELGYYGMAACSMGVMSFRQRQYIRWDAQTQRAVRT